MSEKNYIKERMENKINLQKIKIKRAKRTPTDEQILMIWQLKDDGLTQIQIKDQVGTTRYYVRKILKGTRPIPIPKRIAPEVEDDDELFEDYDSDIDDSFLNGIPDEEFNNLDISEKDNIDFTDFSDEASTEEEIDISPRTYIL